MESLNMFHPLKNPPQWLLDGLLKEEKECRGACHDCGAASGSKHLEGCDTARCLATKGFNQRLCCDCGNCGEDIWTGVWPGTDETYKYGLVCFDDRDGTLSFDYNRVREMQMSSPNEIKNMYEDMLSKLDIRDIFIDKNDAIKLDTSFEPIVLNDGEAQYLKFIKECEHVRDRHIAALGISKDQINDNK
jgi:hypothetical protein